MDPEKTLPGLSTNPLLVSRKHHGDRRIYPRLPTLSLSTQVKVRYGWLTKWRVVRLTDFNHTGVAFDSEHHFKPGQSIIMRLRLTIDDTDITVPDVVAIVRYQSGGDPPWRHGAEFQFDANSHMRASTVQLTLKRIENLVRRAMQTPDTN